MAYVLIDPKNTTAYKDYLNADPEFKIAARYMTKDVCIEVGIPSAS